MPGAALGAGYLSRTAADGFVRAKERAAEPAAAAKGDMCSGTSTAAQIRCRACGAGPFPPSPKKNRLGRFLVYAPPAPMVGPFNAANIVYF